MNVEVRNCTIYDLENCMYINGLGSSLEGYMRYLRKIIIYFSHL